jgi:hypothetical protein
MIRGEVFEGNVYGKIGWNYSILRSMNEFWQFKYDLLTLGILQTKSEIDEIRYITDFDLNLQIDFPTLSINNTTREKEFESKRKEYSQLVYSVRDLENFSFMIGIKQSDIREEIKSKENKTILDLNGERTEENSENFVKDYSDTTALYGLTLIKDIISMPETSVSLFGSITNYKENNGFGVLGCNNYLNAKLGNKNSKIFLTIAGNGSNFCDYFKEEIKNTINPIGSHLESKLHTDLLRKSNGIFLTYSREDKTNKFGGIVGFLNKSYIELGQIEGEGRKGNYFRFGSPSLQIGFNSETYSNSEMHGNRTNLEISGVKKGWNINLRLEPMEEELGIKSVGLYVSKTFKGPSKLLLLLLRSYKHNIYKVL